jgi:thiazole/oxazole-forming peptide maturase SagC family component
MDKKLCLHSSINFVDNNDDGKIYISMPGGESITFESSSFPIIDLLNTLRDKAYTTNELIELDMFSSYGDNVSKLLNILKERHIVVESADMGSKDELSCLYDYISRRAVRSSVFSPEDYASKKIRVLGTGFVANICEKVVGELGRKAQDTDKDVLTVVCADNENYSWFEEINEQMISDKQPALYVWKGGSHLNLGPLVIPHETPCFHCFKKRLESNVHFIDEFEDLHKPSAMDNIPILDENNLLTGVVQYLLNRHLSFIINDVTSLVAGGNLYEFNFVTAKLESHPVLKLPRCGTCGQLREDELTRAVRNLL